MDKKDWIILRLVFEALRGRPCWAPDHNRAVEYLIETYGLKRVEACIDQLHEEKPQRNHTSSTRT